MRSVAILQQKAQALEAEIEERKRIEEALRIATSELRDQVEEMKAVQEASRRYEAVLSESERRFRTMADSAPVLMWLTDARGKCVYVNRPWLEFTGNSMEAELARDPGEGVHPDDAAKCGETVRKAAESKMGFHMEYRYRRADGAWRWLLDTGSPRRGEDGSFLGYIGSCVDITDAKDTEDQLRQAQKMEAVGRLAGGIAHDFNNLLTAINGYSEMALAMAADDATLTEFLSEIKRAGERAASLTHQLLAYSRKQILAPAVFDLNETVADMERMLRRLIGEHIEMESILAPGLGMVRADPGQVQQIILNLVLNARDAMPGGGRLILETSNVIPDARPDQSSLPHVMLSVRDTGSGMSADVKARIFEPFFTTKDVGKGTGLGLSSVYGIIRQSGGFVTVESEAGRGSEFRVHLPIAEADIVPGPGTGGQARQESSRNETILLVEDEETVRKFIHRTLTGHGYVVLEAKDGPTALVLGEKCHNLDMLLTDVIMPNMNGAVLAERLKAFHPGMGILFMSGYTDNVFLPGGLLEPGAKFLQKPFAQADMLQKVKELLDSRARA
jgi:PAS domain S-box-containing protein